MTYFVTLKNKSPDHQGFITISVVRTGIEPVLPE
jgi:hypothetical protein